MPLRKAKSSNPSVAPTNRWERPLGDCLTRRLESARAAALVALSRLGRVKARLNGLMHRGSGAHHDRKTHSVVPEKNHGPGVWERRAIDELARVFYEQPRAILLVMEAGFPVAMMPTFTSPQVFWARVAQEARNGALHGGLRPILVRALEQYSANPVFARALAEDQPSGSLDTVD